MALIKCPECGKEISDKAETCIQCGFPIKDPGKASQSAYSEPSGIDYQALYSRFGKKRAGAVKYLCSRTEMSRNEAKAAIDAAFDEIEKSPNKISNADSTRGTENNNQPQQIIIKKKRGCLGTFFAVVGVIAVVVIAIAAISLNQPETDTTPEPTSQTNVNAKTNDPTAVPTVEPTSITAEALYRAYDENAVAADQTYKGKTLKVSGVIDAIDKDMFSNLYITLKADEYGFTGVQCYFAKSHENELAGLSKGSSVNVVGVCDGQIITYVTLRKCSLSN